MTIKSITLPIFLLFSSINICFAQTLTEKKIVVNKNSIYYYDISIGKTTLFFIHGSFIDKEYWKEQLSYFSPKYRVIAMDLVGHGKSTHNRDNYTVNQYGKDVAVIIEKLKLKKVILIGHSVGADIMLENANAKKVIGIIGIDYFKNVGYQIPDTVVAQLMVAQRKDFKSSSEQYAKRALLSNKTESSIAERVLASYKNMNPSVGISMNEDFFGYTKREVRLLSQLNKKLYLINVNYQPTNETNLRKYLKDNYSLSIINGTCHFPMIENPKVLNESLNSVILKIVGK